MKGKVISMAKKQNTNDAALQQKLKVLQKLRDNAIKSEKELQSLTAERMVKIPGITVQEMEIIIELQKSVKNGKLYTYLIEAEELLIPACVSGGVGTEAEDGEEGDLYDA